MDGRVPGNGMCVAAAALTRVGGLAVVWTVIVALVVAAPAGAGAACTAGSSSCTSDTQCCAGSVCEGNQCQPGCRVGGQFRPPWLPGSPPTSGCSICDPTISTTSLTNAPDGSTCDLTSMNKCIEAPFFCHQGTCIGSPVDCTGGSPACTAPYCDPDVGCVYPPLTCPTITDPTVALCFAIKCDSILDKCVEVCTKSVCATPGQAGCGAVNGCTSDADCPSTDPCFVGRCVESVCGWEDTDCNDGDLCTTDFCQAGHCSTTTMQVCATSNDCPPQETCVGGGCQHAPAPPSLCDDGIPCTADSCANNACVHTPTNEFCDDGNPCTTDVCQGLACAGDPSKSCSSNADCPGICVSGTCPSDGVACSTNAECTSGACVSNGCQHTPPGVCSVGLNHFLCYQIDRGPVDQTVNLTTSEFGSTSAVVRRAQLLCAPADKEQEDPAAPADVDHLTGYSLLPRAPFEGRRNQVVVNQFGTLTVDLIRPPFLFVPTGKSTSAPPPSYTPGIDHFECFRTVHARFRESGIAVEDQFGTRTVNVRRPSRLCVPVDKNGSGITNPSASLLCYRVDGAPRINGTHVFTTNQFGNDEYDVRAVRELCVPSQLNPGGPTATPAATSTPQPSATATATSTPTETVTPSPTATPTATITPTPTVTPGCGNGVIDPGETCDPPGGNCNQNCRLQCSLNVQQESCGGDCPTGQVCSAFGNVACECVPGSTPCAGYGDASFPTCGGDCGPGLVCQSVDPSSGPTACLCADPSAPCSTGTSQCGTGFFCPSGQTCFVDFVLGAPDVCDCGSEN